MTVHDIQKLYEARLGKPYIDARSVQDIHATFYRLEDLEQQDDSDEYIKGAERVPK